MPDDIPRGDAQQQPTRAPDDLAAAEAAGALSFAAPGSAEADTFDRARADELDARDAEVLERDGPDALTRDRAYRMTQSKQQQSAERLRAIEAAEGDHDLTGYLL